MINSSLGIIQFAMKSLCFSYYWTSVDDEMILLHNRYAATAAFQLRDMAKVYIVLSTILSGYEDFNAPPPEGQYMRNQDKFNRFSLKPATIEDPAKPATWR